MYTIEAAHVWLLEAPKRREIDTDLYPKPASHVEPAVLTAAVSREQLEEFATCGQMGQFQCVTVRKFLTTTSARLVAIGLVVRNEIGRVVEPPQGCHWCRFEIQEATVWA